MLLSQINMKYHIVFMKTFYLGYHCTAPFNDSVVRTI